MTRRSHLMPFGPRVEPGGVRFRLWAPDADKVTLHLGGIGDRAMRRRADGWVEAFVAGAGPGTRYGFKVGDKVVPDPAARSQPDDVHGLSEVVDPLSYEWSDDDWRGRPWHEAAIYEMHVGTFTPEGTFAAAARRLDHLERLGVTAIELMPVAEFAGRRGWGYDGVYWFAPDSSYGRPEDLKAFVEAAHARNLMVLLDVVYNHFGPEGNYLHAYARRFFTDRHHTPWGQGLNYDGEGAEAVRAFVIHNALHWLEEYNFDGLRLDAVHAIADDGAEHILLELARIVRETITDRQVHLVLENDANAVGVLEGHYRAQWNDDIHHALHCLLTGEAGGYYRDYASDPARHLCRCLAEGFAYQGEASGHRGGARRGDPSSHLPPTAFVSFLQNHDQVGNRAFGERMDALASPKAVEAATALVLLAPMPPLLFQGEEWGASTPFQFFCDLGPDLAKAVRAGRRREFENFPDFKGRIPDPMAAATFARSKLDWAEMGEGPHARRMGMVRDLLDIRRREIVPRLPGMDSMRGDCRALGPRVVEAEWRMGDSTLLRVSANLSPAPATGIVPGRGRLLYSTHGGIGGLPAWGVVWTLDEESP